MRKYSPAVKAGVNINVLSSAFRRLKFANRSRLKRELKTLKLVMREFWFGFIVAEKKDR